MRNNKKKERFLHYKYFLHINENKQLFKYYCLMDNLKYENTFKN